MPARAPPLLCLFIRAEALESHPHHSLDPALSGHNMYALAPTITLIAMNSACNMQGQQQQQPGRMQQMQMQLQQQRQRELQLAKTERKQRQQAKQQLKENTKKTHRKWYKKLLKGHEKKESDMENAEDKTLPIKEGSERKLFMPD
ncbi:PREDICTED: uncharacterized protein LOC108617281 [Drosophila arizonae]|uniref:Uncharacterized protein LOC108617281 n=1 Tax=Drosophila arizonae TaxID=7263 RepID=A0ABM1PMR6_DROAR|nr:PREDICTED: uncharacterized protein LOC108617281 [Drosophila arizonae]